LYFISIRPSVRLSTRSSGEIHYYGKGKGKIMAKINLEHATKAQRGSKGVAVPSLIAALDGDE
jgi:hypothetical protein